MTSIKWQSQDLFHLPLFSVYLIICAVSIAGLLSPSPAYSTNWLPHHPHRPHCPLRPPGLCCLFPDPMSRLPSLLPARPLKSPWLPTPKDSHPVLFLCLGSPSPGLASWNIFSPGFAGVDYCRVSGSRLASDRVVVRDPALGSHRPGFESWVYHQQLGSLTPPKPQFLPL